MAAKWQGREEEDGVSSRNREKKEGKKGGAVTFTRVERPPFLARPPPVTWRTHTEEKKCKRINEPHEGALSLSLYELLSPTRRLSLSLLLCAEKRHRRIHSDCDGYQRDPRTGLPNHFKEFASATVRCAAAPTHRLPPAHIGIRSSF